MTEKIIPVFPAFPDNYTNEIINLLNCNDSG